jgi:hypothetical protein
MPGPGGLGGGGAGGGSSAVDKFDTPVEGAQSWLNALKSGDLEAVKTATALRGQTEASTKAHKDLFASFVSDDGPQQEDVADLAKGFEGFKVVGKNTAKSTGQIGVILEKTEGRNTLRRTLTMRKEKDGWKVMDFGGTGTIKAFGIGRPPGQRKRNN